ncbi:MAG: isopeptide-forming domain-containing fimbrial protein [Clostridia bacterium]|nr:isopeptide-forming domain-containing fimbrial protein [Clostridia bacterium]
MKKFFSVLLVLVMLSAFMLPVTAENDGSITLIGIEDSVQYDVYKLLDLESYNTTSNAYSYKVNSTWAGFFATSEALEYVEINAEGYVSWLKDSAADTVAFSELALAYAQANGIQPTQSSANENEMAVSTDAESGKATGTFSGLSLGYYLVDSNLGSLCALTTTKPHADVVTKNGIPTITKEVMEDSDSSWGGDASADMKQIISYQATIYATAGAQGYVMHDKMTDAFEELQINSVKLNGVDMVEGRDYILYTFEGYTDATDDDVEDDCTFEIAFTQEFCDGLTNDDVIVVAYQAVLGEDAIIAGVGNANTTWLEYGEGHFTTQMVATTYTYAWDLVKTDSSDVLLDGAHFRIYDAATEGNEVKVVKINDQTYRRAGDDEEGDEIVVVGGKVRLIGFDSDTYYLEETVAPSGYNKLNGRQAFTIDDENLDATVENGVLTGGAGVQVVNKTGSEMPETGAMGTIIFVLIGGIVVLGSGILLFAKKRMSQVSE